MRSRSYLAVFEFFSTFSQFLLSYVALTNDITLFQYSRKGTKIEYQRVFLLIFSLNAQARMVTKIMTGVLQFKQPSGYFSKSIAVL